MASLLEIKEIRKTYFQKGKPIKEALKSVSMTINRGEVLGLLGINGAGKTTLSSIVATLHPPSSGELIWEEKSVSQNLIAYRKIIGYCPQYPNIEKRLTLDENLIFAGRCYGLSKQKAISQKDYLLKRFDLLPYARATVDQLSGGYRQRFLIARALIHEPQLVILDEPTVGLDPHVRRQLWEVIKELKLSGITVLLTTHYLDEAEMLSDRVCLIHDGIIRTIDTPDNLKKYHQKNNLEEVFLKFVDAPDADIFNAVNVSQE